MRSFGRIMLMLMVLLGGGAVASGQSGVIVELDQFGVGSVYRPGGMTAIRIKLTSNLAEATNLWVQWQVPNADGDIAECGRSTAISPKQVSYIWLYAWLGPDTNPSSVWTVRAFEERDGVRGAEVGGVRISPSSGLIGASVPVDAPAGMIAVVGDRRLGLEDYGKQQVNRLRPLFAHEDTVLVSGIKPSLLPDRWYGLMPFDAVVWCGENTPPQEMGVGQAEAIREYVRRGGHFIVVLPAAGNAWGLGQPGLSPLEDLLPCRTAGKTARRDEAVKLETLLPAISKHNSIDAVPGIRGAPPELPLRVFKDLRGTFDVIDNHFEPLIALPDGRVFVVQRTFGMGRVTVVGLDIYDGRFGALNLPQADAFWNRILGRRSDTPSTQELKDADTAGRLARGEPKDNPLGLGQLITGSGGISMSSDAGLGLLAAFVLFAAYFLAVGPLGFPILKQYGQVRHAWVVFAGLAAVFTAIAWGVVLVLPKPSGVSHITILDHIARPPTDPRLEEPQFQRAITYFSAYLPSYGKTQVALASDKEQLDLLASWAPPGPPTAKFPNVDQYRVDMLKHPASYALPSRATATQLYANWLGGLDPKWGGMLQVDPADPIVVTYGQDGRESGISGTIINNLPGELKNWTLIWVKNSRPTRRQYEVIEGREQPWTGVQYRGQLNNLGASWKWDAGKNPLTMGGKLNLATDLSRAPSPLQVDIENRYIQQYLNKDAVNAAGSMVITEDDRRRYLEMLGIFNQLDPPTYLKSKGNNDPDTVAFRRELGRELDLSAWLTRPCLIIMGYLEESACPAPLRIGGGDEPPTGKGLTMVRWIYPLPLNEKAAFEDVFAGAEPNPPSPPSPPQTPSETPPAARAPAANP